MEEIVQQWVESFRYNFPLPPPANDESEPTGWSLNIKELQNFSLSPELKAMPDTATFGLKVYISVFNKSTGQFHGRTWTSQLITEVESNFINLTTYGIVSGKDSLIVIEFSLCTKYLNNENVESSLFFTILPIPTESTQSMCPLYQGTPRMLMAMPTTFSNFITSRSGCLLVDLQKYDELLNAIPCIPLCTFFNKPIPGVKSYAPLSLEQTTMLSITGITMNVKKDFEILLHNELNELISSKYRISLDDTHVRVVKYSIHFAVHNTHKIVSDTYKAEVSSINGWSFDGQLSFPNYVKNNPNYALIFQLVISIEIDLSFIETNKLITSTPHTNEKRIFDVVFGYGIVHVLTDSFSKYKLSRAPKNSPFSMRIFQAKNIPMPTIAFNAIFDPQHDDQPAEKRDLAVDFKPLISDDGGALLPFDPKNLPEEPMLMEEFTDKLNTNHLLFLFKFLVPRQNYFERFPVKVFQNVYFRIDIWPFGLVKSEVCRLKSFQDNLIFVPLGSKKDDAKGVIISKDVSLKAYEQVVNYFFLMKSNELQASIVDADTEIILGNFNIRSTALLRQKRPSVQISTYSKLIGVDGELLGNVFVSYGCFGSADHKMVRLGFEQRNPMQRDIIISKSIGDNNAEFRKAVRTSVLPRFELAARYRDGHRKEAMLSDLQKKFLRTRILYPVPGIESRFVFLSVYDPEETKTIYVHSNDERLRFIRRLDDNESEYDTDSPEKVYHIERDESLEFNQEKDVPIPERFILKSQKKGSFKAKPDHEIRLLFAFFAVTDFEENEISVTLNDDSHTLLDCFTVHIKKTASLAQENIHVAIRKDEKITMTLNSINTYGAAISSSSLITATTTIFGTKIVSEALKANLMCYIFFFGKNNAILKITRLHVEVLEDEFLRIDSKLKLNIARYIGTHICCKTSDTRIAQFLNYEQPLILKEPGSVIVKALSSGLVKLVVYNVTKKAQALGLLLSVAETNSEKDSDNLIGTSEITLVLGKAAKKTLEYKNNTNFKKSIRVSTSQTDYIHIDPSHYDVPPNKKVKLRLIFMPRDKEEYIVLHVFVQEADMPKSSLEYYKVTAHYVAEKDDDN